MNIKIRFTSLLICVLIISSGFTSINAQTYKNLTDLGLTSKSALLMDADTGTVLYEQNSHEKLPPASVTKVMTMLLIYEAQSAGKFKWDDLVTVSEHAASMGGSQVFLEPMETQSAEDMTKCISIASANDAAVAMAEFIGKSEDGFVTMMNQKAKDLGMNDTTFKNACGLDADGHITSAMDIAIMSRELITKHPDVKLNTTKWQDIITHKTKRGETEFGLTNTNKLLKWYDGATGLKTGSTGKALYCLSGTAEKNDLSLIGVVMAAPDFQIRFREVMKLFDYGFSNYEIQNGLEKGESVGEIPIHKGMIESVNVVIKNECPMLMQKGENAVITKNLTLMPALKAPIEKGSKVGEMIYTINGKEAARVDVIADNDVFCVDVKTMLNRLWMKWC